VNARDRLTLPADVAEEVLAHARAGLPNEACGLLAGDLATGRVSAFHPARNAFASPRRYDVHPEDLVRIVLAIEAGGEDLVAVFHSHTQTPAVPSPTDLRSAGYPVVHLLATLADRDVALRAWRIESERATEVRLQIG
jgi:proteasome lid subunit RPN8/RPN11